MSSPKPKGYLHMKHTLLIASALSLLLSGCANNSSSTKPATDLSTAAEAKSPTTTFTGVNSRLIGRFDQATKGEAKFTWPGSAIEFRFEGTNAKIDIASQNPVRFILSIDGKTQDLWTQTGTHSYTLANNLPKGNHIVRLTRANESTAGVTSFVNDPKTDGKLLAAPSTQKRLLVIGDSITAGYGVEGSSASCHYTLDTSNQQLTYAALAANALGADLHAIAWSGIGAWRSYGEKTPAYPTILVRSARTLADEPNSAWNPTRYIPDAILINIGTNDYWDGSVTNEYRFAMAKLIATVQTDYPGKPVYLIVSPMLTNKTHEAQKQVLTALAKNNTKVLDLGESTGAEGYGCDYHPNKITHERLGKVLEGSLKADLNW